MNNTEKTDLKQVDTKGTRLIPQYWRSATFPDHPRERRPEHESIYYASHAPSDKANEGVGEERKAIDGEKAIANNEHLGPKVEVAESDRCDIDDRYRHPMLDENAHSELQAPVADVQEDEVTDTRNEVNLHAQQQRPSKGQDVSDKNDKRIAPRHIKTKRDHICTPSLHRSNVNGTESNLRHTSSTATTRSTQAGAKETKIDKLGKGARAETHGHF